jgi:hypothetical protein
MRGALTNPLSAAVGSLTFACYADEVAKGSQSPQGSSEEKSAVVPPRGSGVRATQGWRGKKSPTGSLVGKGIALSTALDGGAFLETRSSHG